MTIMLANKMIDPKACVKMTPTVLFLIEQSMHCQVAHSDIMFYTCPWSYSLSHRKKKKEEL